MIIIDSACLGINLGYIHVRDVTLNAYCQSYRMIYRRQMKWCCNTGLDMYLHTILLASTSPMHAVRPCAVFEEEASRNSLEVAIVFNKHFRHSLAHDWVSVSDRSLSTRHFPRG